MAEKIAIELEVNQTGQGVGNLKQQLREATLQAQSLAEKFGATSKEAINAAQRAAHLREEIADVRDTINALNPEAKFNSIIAVGQGIAGGFAAAQGAMALFGAESEDVQKALLKVQAAMALSSGLNDLRGLSDGFKNLTIVVKSSAIYTKLATAAQTAYNFVVGAGTTAMKLFRVALAATGIGAAIVGVTLLYQNWEKLNKFVEKNSEELKKWGLIIARILFPPIMLFEALYKGVQKLGENFDFVRDLTQKVGEKFSLLKDKVVELLTTIGILSTAEESNAEARQEQSKVKEAAIKREIELAKAQGATEVELAALEVKLAREKFQAYDAYIQARYKAGRDLTQEERDQYAQLAQDLKVSKIEEQKAIEDANKKQLEENKKKWEKKKEQDKKAAEEEEKLRQQLQDLRIQNITDERERERVLLQADFDKKIAAIKGESEIELQIVQQLAVQNQLAKNELEAKFAEEDRQIKLDNLQKDYEAKNTLLEAQKLQDQLSQAELDQIEMDQASLLNAKNQADETLTREQKILSEAEYQNKLTTIAKNAQLKRLADEKAKREASFAVATGAVQGLSALASALTKEGEKQSKASKILAVAQLGIDTAKAISSTIAGASAAASAGGPAAPLLLVGYIASGIATVIGNFKSAKKLLGDSSTPSVDSAAGSGSLPSLSSASVGVAPPRLTSTDGPRTQLTNQEKAFNVTVNAQVVETDITKNQKRIKDIEDKAAF